MKFTVKDFLNMMLLNNETIEVDLMMMDCGCKPLVYDYCGTRKTFNNDIDKYGDAIITSMESYADDEGIICFTLFIDANDAKIK